MNATHQQMSRSTQILSGIDGSNPLGFLAALGTHRVMSMIFPDAAVEMSWQVIDCAWRPTLAATGIDLTPDSLCSTLVQWLAEPPQLPLLESKELGDNLTIAPQTFRFLALKYLDAAASGDANANAALEFLAAFGTDAAYQPHSKDRQLMQDSALRTMSGAGHQHFIKFMRAIIENTDADHLRRTLFERWTYEDEGRGLNLRWDPIDDRRYAMRWKNPSADASMAMRGANRLAIEGLPLFASAPSGNDLTTTGFRFRHGAFWSWPIWQDPIEITVVRSILQRAEISDLSDNVDLSSLPATGIVAVFRSQRITVGKFRNFTPAQAVI